MNTLEKTLSSAPRGQRPFRALFWLSAFLLGACSLSGPIREDRKAKFYGFGLPSAGWKEIILDTKDLAADHVFVSQKTGAVISIGSLCDRYADSSLESLTKDLMNPLHEVEVRSQETKMVDGREGLLTDFHGTLDGVGVEMRAFVIRKDDCLFDFTVNAKDQLVGGEENEFKRVYEGFRYRSSGAAP